LCVHATRGSSCGLLSTLPASAAPYGRYTLPPCSCCAPTRAGPEAWLNPVDPPLPADFKEGELHLASEKAAQAVLGAAAIAKLKPPKIVVRP
jgi:hypothetical protein